MKLILNLKSKILNSAKIAPRGFSLLEIMVSFFILTVAFIGLAQSFPMGLAANKTAENETIASYLAQTKMEELISIGYENISAGILEAKHRLSADPANYLYNFQRAAIAAYLDENLQESLTDRGLKKIEITVYFLNAANKSENNLTVKTLISQK